MMTDIDRQEFRKRLKAAIDAKNLSQGELAKRIGVVQSAISQVLNTNRLPRVEILVKLADELDVGIDDLLGRQAGSQFEMVCRSPKVAGLVSKFVSLNLEDQDRVVKIINALSSDGISSTT